MIVAERTETALSLELSVDKNGGQTGLTAVVAIRDGATTNSWLDFNDGTFKTSGWTTRQAAMTEVSVGNAPGVYRATLDLTTVTLPTGPFLVAEFDVSGTVVGNTIEVITLVDTFKRIAPAGLLHENSMIDNVVTNTGKFVTSSRIRHFATAAALAAATAGAADDADSEIARYLMVAAPTVANGSILSTFQITKDL